MLLTAVDFCSRMCSCFSFRMVLRILGKWHSRDDYCIPVSKRERVINNHGKDKGGTKPHRDEVWWHLCVPASSKSQKVRWGIIPEHPPRAIPRTPPGVIQGQECVQWCEWNMLPSTYVGVPTTLTEPHCVGQASFGCDILCRGKQIKHVVLEYRC